MFKLAAITCDEFKVTNSILNEIYQVINHPNTEGVDHQKKSQ